MMMIIFSTVQYKCGACDLDQDKAVATLEKKKKNLLDLSSVSYDNIYIYIIINYLVKLFIDKVTVI